MLYKQLHGMALVSQIYITHRLHLSHVVTFIHGPRPLCKTLNQKEGGGLIVDMGLMSR